MESFNSNDIIVLNDTKCRIALQRNDVLFLTAIGKEEAYIMYPWHATVDNISHMTQVATYQGFTEHLGSGECFIDGEDYNIMSLSPTKVVPLTTDNPNIEIDEDWFEEEEDD
jgi:hypothetical protein